MNGSRLMFCKWAMDRIDRLVLWAAKGNYFVDERGQICRLPEDTAYDCSGLCMSAVMAITGKDLRDEWNAQKISDTLPTVETPEPGDFGVYGADRRGVIHVVIAMAGGNVLSADGATQSVRTAFAARARGAKVRLHSSPDFYKSAPFLGWRKNTFVDNTDQEKTPVV